MIINAIKCHKRADPYIISLYQLYCKESKKMKILLDDNKLNLLLERKREFIGRKVVWDSLISSISLSISVFLSSYNQFPNYGNLLKVVFICTGLFFTAKSIYDIAKSKNNNYTVSDLFDDINSLNEITHNHSIVVIKDTFNGFSNKYLVYDDKRWNCEFFINYRETENNDVFIREHISNELNIPLDSISLSFRGQRIHTKYSPIEKKEKLYCHKFYIANVSEFNDNIKSPDFEIDGKKYHWRTIEEILENNEVKQKNTDIVKYVQELI